MRLSESVCLAIDLDHHSRRWTVEVGDIGADGMLTTKAKPGAAKLLQSQPE
jgi:hypothetical protein